MEICSVPLDFHFPGFISVSQPDWQLLQARGGILIMLEGCPLPPSIQGGLPGVESVTPRGRAQGELHAPLRPMLRDCPPVLCCLRSHRSRQMVAALTAHRPQSLRSDCQLGSPAFPLVPLAWRWGPGAVGGVGRQQWGWKGDRPQRSQREVLMSTLRRDLRRML